MTFVAVPLIHMLKYFLIRVHWDIKNFCSFIDTVESSSTVLLTPWSQAPQYYWHSGVRLRLIINITKSDSTVLMTPLSQTWYTVFHFSKVFYSALKRKLAKCLTPCFSWLILIWIIDSLLIFKVLKINISEFYIWKSHADSAVSMTARIFLWHRRVRAVFYHDFCYKGTLASSIKKFVFSIRISPRNRSQIRKHFNVLSIRGPRWIS